MSGFEGLTDTWSSGPSTETTPIEDNDSPLNWTLRDLIKYNCPAEWRYAINEIQKAGILVTPEMVLGTIQNWMDQNIVPRPQNLFSMFQRVPPSAVRVVFLFQDPYPGFRQDGTPKATGRALEGMINPALRGMPSCYSADDIIPASLRKLFLKLIEEYPSIPMPVEGTLENWYTQGVFMMNIALTCIAGHPNSHAGIWNGFSQQILNYLSILRVAEGKQLILVVFGKEAQKIERHISNRIIMIKSAHPSPLATKYFKECFFFRKINEHLMAMGDPEINWTL